MYIYICWSINPHTPVGYTYSNTPPYTPTSQSPPGALGRPPVGRQPIGHGHLHLHRSSQGL